MFFPLRTKSAFCKMCFGNNRSTKPALLRGANSHIHFHNHMGFSWFPLLGSPVNFDESSAAARTAANYRDGRKKGRKEGSQPDQSAHRLPASAIRLRRRQIGSGVPVTSHQVPSDLWHRIRHGGRGFRHAGLQKSSRPHIRWFEYQKRDLSAIIIFKNKKQVRRDQLLRGWRR